MCHAGAENRRAIKRDGTRVRLRVRACERERFEDRDAINTTRLRMLYALSFVHYN